MSTDYCLLKKVRACDLFSSRLEEFGVREHVNPELTNKNRRCLTDGRNYVWVFIDDDLFVLSLGRWGANAPGKILGAVADVCDTDVVSEYDPRHYGFDTKEEWEEDERRRQMEREEESYIELLKYCRGEPNDNRFYDMRRAEIAKTLVDKDPSLLLPINKEKLLNEIQSIYDRDCAVSREALDEDPVAFFKRLAEENEAANKTT
jgi:hypothetical protein